VFNGDEMETAPYITANPNSTISRTARKANETILSQSCHSPIAVVAALPTEKADVNDRLLEASSDSVSSGEMSSLDLSEGS
jgi:hypothetical protein